MKRWAIGLLVLIGAGFNLISAAADFNGDGTGDIAIFRPGAGLWSVRGVTRLYSGSAGDAPVPGDYDGNGTDGAVVFRPSGGLWAALGLTRVYFGNSTDEPMPGDYNGDGTEDFGIFRAGAGLWGAYGITRVYFGSAGDTALAPGLTRHVAAGGGSLLQTGQTISYRDHDDGWYEKGLAFRYTDHGDGTVTDNVTGLMWAKDGNGEGCNWGEETGWDAAISYCGKLVLGGKTGWRLPNRRELQSLIDYGTWNPSINTTFFPNTKPFDYYWTSTTVDYYTQLAWCVVFSDGYVDYDHLKNSEICQIRAVRGGD